jgi:hypothetical protein
MDGLTLHEEMCLHIQRLPLALLYDHTYPHEDFCRAFLVWEHQAQRAIRDALDFQASEEYGVIAAAASRDEEEEE